MKRAILVDTDKKVAYAFGAENFGQCLNDMLDVVQSGEKLFIQNIKSFDNLIIELRIPVEDMPENH